MNKETVSRQTISAKNIVRFGVPTLVVLGGVLTGCSLNPTTPPENTISPTNTLTPENTPTPTPTLMPTPENTKVPVMGGIEFKPFENRDEVAQVRGGDRTNWVAKVENYAKDSSDSWAVRKAHYADGTEGRITVSKIEWCYRGPMSDLKPEYQIPQTQEDIAKQLGGNVNPENIRLIKITKVSENPGYASWMDLWNVPEGTVIGYELMQNHQTDGKLFPYEIKLPPGALIEMYDDQQTENPKDDIAATIYNPNSTSIKLFLSGGTVWPWGDPTAITIEQSNFTNGASSFATDNKGNLIALSVASNVKNNQTSHYIAEINPDTGKVSLGDVNLVSK